MNPRTYEVRVSGLVPHEVLESPAVAEVTEEPVRTVIRTTPSDQAALLGLLDRLRALGVDLLEVRQLIDDEEAPEPAATPGEPSGQESVPGP